MCNFRYPRSAACQFSLTEDFTRIALPKEQLSSSDLTGLRFHRSVAVRDLKRRMPACGVRRAGVCPRG
jgi:hypothetical protein